jgi:RNA polymerase sigma factor (sigma-70 family)
MNAPRLLRFVRQTAPPVGNDPVDTELLRRYATERDETAFAELVRRNGPLVLRTCRHILGEANAEDAFQATFLLLVRSAGRLTRPGSLAGWLHAAAVRIARRARRGENRRREREAALHTPRLAPDDLTWREVREVLDRELAALPEKYRVPLVLCYLQELSYEEAARQTGCPVGALRGRLERGKAQLRKRLARYGLPLAAPALILGPPTQVSAALAEATLVTVRVGANGGPIPAAISGLLGPRTGLRVSLLAPLVIALAAVGAVLAVGDFPADDKSKGDPPKTANRVAEAAPQPAVDRLGDPLPPGAVARLGTRRLFGPDDPRWTAFSPDGTKVASQNYHQVTVRDAATGRLLVERTDYWSMWSAIGWRADGTGVAVVRLADQSFFVSAFTDPNEKLPNTPPKQAGPGRVGPDGLEFLALSPDARTLAVVRSPDAKEFTVDLLPATTGTPVAGLKPVKTFGPFAGPCREVRYTARGVQFLTGSWKEDGDWTISLVDHDKNAIARATAIPPPAYCVWGSCTASPPTGALRRSRCGQRS